MIKKKVMLDFIKQEIHFYGPGCDLNHINVSRIINMASLFSETTFNGNISEWDTSKVVDMMFMFEHSKFNGDLSKWNVAKVKDMWGMFEGSNFNKDISSWDVSNVLDMDCMFIESRFNGDLSHWSFKNDVMITNFFDSDKLDQFEIPNMYHWHLLLNGFVTQNAQWQEHVDACVPIIRSLSFTEKEAAMFMHKAWMNQELGCKTALSVPFEFLEMP